MTQRRATAPALAPRAPIAPVARRRGGANKVEEQAAADPSTEPLQARLDALPDPVILVQQTERRFAAATGGDAAALVALSDPTAARRAWRVPRNACPT